MCKLLLEKEDLRAREASQSLHGKPKKKKKGCC